MLIPKVQIHKTGEECACGQSLGECSSPVVSRKPAIFVSHVSEELLIL